MFSVLISVYKGEKVQNFIQSMESILNQTLKASEIILIRDGVVYDELQEAIDFFVKNNDNIVYCPFESNSGLGHALNYGVGISKNDIIFRMDSDDIACLNRFEKQYHYLLDHPTVDVLGGQILEFNGEISNIIGKREVPIENNDICAFMKKRNAFNHMTVAFRKEKVIACGNYLDLHYLEDYYLWCRMLKNNCVFHNLEDVLVYARVDDELYKRRGGLSYFKSWKQLERFKLNAGIVSFPRYLSNLISRFVIQVLLPNKIRAFLFKKVGRKQ